MPTFIIGPAFPLMEDEEGKYKVYGVSDTTKVVDQNIKMVLLTRKGEWIGRPGFGVGLHNYLFETHYDIANGSNNMPPLRENIIAQLTTYIPYIKLTDVQVNTTSNDRSINVKIRYFVKDSNLASELDLTISDTNDFY